VRRRLKFVPILKEDVVKKLLDIAPIKIGSGDKAILVFFDLKCPFCARMFKESEDYLLSLAKSGKAVYAMCDFVVHRDAEALHGYLRCLDDVEKRYEFVKSVFLSRKTPQVKPCGPVPSECKTLAEELGVVGTPSIVVFDFRKSKGLAYFGYLPLGEVMEMVESV